MTPQLPPQLPTLCFGGSFNPIHHGHLIVATAVAEAAGFGRVLLIPSAQPPHKPDAKLASADDRLQMIRLAIAESQLFDCDDLEIRRGGASYTVDTARALKQRGWTEVHWLIGADMLPTLLTWREPAALLQAVRFVVAERPGHSLDWQALPPELAALRPNLVAAPRIDISSSLIRSRVGAGRAIDFLTPPAVVKFIHEKGLYKSAPAGPQNGS
jgi:nicotinate-nucleotide adenylyltransferase